VSYTPRVYRVVKARVGPETTFLVVAEDLDDPDLWTVINRVDSATAGWQYVREVNARNRSLCDRVLR
jgi:hypothetical protein